MFFGGIGGCVGGRDLVVSVVGTVTWGIMSELSLVVYVHMSKLLIVT